MAGSFPEAEEPSRIGAIRLYGWMILLSLQGKFEEAFGVCDEQVSVLWPISGICAQLSTLSHNFEVYKAG